MDGLGDNFSAAHFGSDDDFALVFGFDGQQASTSDVGVEECEVGIVSDGGTCHFLALLQVVDQMHMGAGVEVDAATAGMQIDHHIDLRK